MKIIRGSFFTHREKIEPLLKKHWDEIMAPAMPEVSLNIDLEAYAALERQNRLLQLALYDNDQSTILGYGSWFIYEHPHYKGIRCALTDCFFVNPKKRSFTTGKGIIRMFKMAEKILKEEFQVQYITMGANIINKLEKFAIKMGFKPLEVIYKKRI